MIIIKNKLSILPYDTLIIIIRHTCYKSLLNLICINKYFYNLYDELNRHRKENMLECASILINNGFKIYGKFCRDLLNDICPQNINLFCYITNNNKNNINSKINSNRNTQYLSLPNNLKKYIKMIENNKLHNDRELCKLTKCYFIDIFKNKMIISNVVILKKHKLLTIVVIIYFKETYIELHLDFPDIIDIYNDFWCNSLVLSSIKNCNNNITKKDILNVFNDKKYTSNVSLEGLIENENFTLKKIIKSVKEKIAIPINECIYLNNDKKYMCDNCTNKYIHNKLICSNYICSNYICNNSICNNCALLLKNINENENKYHDKNHKNNNNINKNNINKNIIILIENNYNIKNNCNMNLNICNSNYFEKKYICEHINHCKCENIHCYKCENKYYCKCENIHCYKCENKYYCKCENIHCYKCENKYYCKCENNFNNNIYKFQKNFLNMELQGFKILINRKHVNYKQIKWLNKKNV